MTGNVGGQGFRVGYDLANDQDREDRRKHLELVQAVVTRLAGASAAAKGWSITVAGAAFGVAVVRASWFIFLLGVGALVVFGVMDGLYLHNERKFRDLYAAIVQNSVKPLLMDVKQAGVRRAADSHRSWSVAGFYVPLALGGLILMGVSISKGNEKQQQPPSAPAQSSTTTSSPAPHPPTTPGTVNSPSTTPSASTEPSTTVSLVPGPAPGHTR